MNDEAHVGPIGPPGNLPSAFIAHIYLPTDLTREAYVNHCYATNTVMLITAYSEIFKRVPISDNDIQQITFPADNTVLGSPVVCVVIPLHQQPVVVGVLKFPDARPTQLKERTLRRVVLGESTAFSFNVDGDSGTFQLSTKSNDTSTVKMLSSELTAILDIYVQGDVNLAADNFVTMLTQEGFKLKVGLGDQQKIIDFLTDSGFTYADDYKNKVSITAEGLHYTFDGKSQKGLLGEDTANWLKELADVLQKLTVSTVFGPSGFPLNIADIIKLKAKVDTLLSSKTSYA
jgi:hypothetical protein